MLIYWAHSSQSFPTWEIPLGVILHSVQCGWDPFMQCQVYANLIYSCALKSGKALTLCRLERTIYALSGSRSSSRFPSFLSAYSLTILLQLSLHILRSTHCLIRYSCSFIIIAGVSSISMLWHLDAFLQRLVLNVGRFMLIFICLLL